jgi:hypothetical protein
MLSSSRFNYLIELSQKLIAAVTRMRDSYAAFPALIEEEHAMIKAHTYTDRLLEVCNEKNILASQITECFEELQHITQQLFNICAAGQFEDYLRMLDKYKMEYCEVSDGSITMPHQEKCHYIERLANPFCICFVSSFEVIISLR